MNRLPLLAALALGACANNEPFDFDFTCTIPTSELFFGGVSRDGIPALNQPKTVAADEVEIITDAARVLGVEINGEARAYPMTVLWWHEIVNDEIGGVPVLVTYCPLTGSGIVFDPVIDGRTRRFGVSGLLFENNLTMFDRDNESLWNQMLLGSQCGPDRGASLARIPVVETTLGQWKAMHPNTRVVSRDTGFDQPYGFYPYGNYDRPTNPNTLFPSSPFSDAHPPKELTLGIHRGDQAVAFPFEVLEAEGSFVVVNDTVGDRPFVVVWMEDTETALAYDRRVADRVLTFTADPATGQLRDDETGSTWDVTGRAVAGPLLGNRLNLVEDAYVVFWFAWSVYYPNTAVYRDEPGQPESLGVSGRSGSS